MVQQGHQIGDVRPHGVRRAVADGGEVTGELVHHVPQRCWQRGMRGLRATISAALPSRISHLLSLRPTRAGRVFATAPRCRPVLPAAAYSRRGGFGLAAWESRR
ncbi:hypothetical protein Jiend_13600 [Micromonospora endophytica]|nr:hypothetical protein Jiend_13600 [Micromonospora endophytica]